MNKPALLATALMLATLAPAAAVESNIILNPVAEGYVKLALEVGAYSPGYIDAYYGPKEWAVSLDDATRRRGFPAAALRQKADGLLRQLDAAAREALPPMDRLRASFLEKQLIAVRAQVDVLSGKKFSFDQESRLFYDAVEPARPQAGFEKALSELEALLPGDGSLSERLAAFRREFLVPADKAASVFDAAIAECRRRTLKHIDLPVGERFTAAYVNDKPWGAYNWYKGGAYSLIEINTDLPMRIDTPLRWAAHEGYPGHHAYNSLLEEKLAKQRGWIEFTVYPLFSPQSLIAEGTANYGIDLLFPGDERLEFEKRALYPLAGLDPGKADRLARVEKLTGRLSLAGNQASRAYLDGAMTREEARRWLERYGLETPEQAEKSLQFTETYRSYVINYTLGEEIVRAHVDRVAGPKAVLERKWQVFYELLTTPRVPSGLSGNKTLDVSN
jgi:hypothetical protein